MIGKERRDIYDDCSAGMYTIHRLATFNLYMVIQTLYKEKSIMVGNKYEFIKTK